MKKEKYVTIDTSTIEGLRHAERYHRVNREGNYNWEAVHVGNTSITFRKIQKQIDWASPEGRD